MKILTRFVTKKNRGGVSVRDEWLDSDSIVFGRSTSCDVELSDPRVLLEHATLTNRSGELYVESLQGAPVAVNRTLVQSSKVTELDRLEIGPFLVIIQPPKGDSDLTLSIELTDPLGDELENLRKNTELDIRIVGTTKRVWSWAAFAVILLSVLIWPMVTSWFTPDAIVNVESAVNQNVEATPTAIWTSGGISSAHKFFGENCEVCHEKPFIPVQDTACLACHKSIENHADPVRFPSASFDDHTCQNCHKEHQGDQSVARNDQGFCVSCHIDIKADEPESLLRDVSDFGTDHPDLYPSLVVNASQQTISRAIPMSSNPEPTESSGLSFPHADHLREAGVRHPRLGIIQLDCRSCHVPDEGGVSMLPISFERHCHQCHELNFDVQLPGREMIHGQPEELFQQIADIYQATAMRGGYTEPEAPELVRRRPGEPLTEEQRAEARDWAEQKSGQILNGRFGRGQCDECHTIFDNPQTGIWIVEPVLITDDWFPKSVFDHASHSDVDCTTCHNVEESISSSDVLMPKIETCRSCHGGEDAPNRVPSTCVTCHKFHIDHLGPMRDEDELEQAEGPHHRRFAVVQPATFAYFSDGGR